MKTVVTTAPKPSFFHYFGMPMTEEEEAEAEENEDEEAVQVKLSMEEDYDIGHSIRTSIIPEAVLWYTGEAMDNEDDEDDDEDDEVSVRGNLPSCCPARVSNGLLRRAFTIYCLP